MRNEVGNRVVNVDKFEFGAVLRLQKDDPYRGSGEHVILVWHENQITPAEQYHEAHFPGKVVDIVICEDPNSQKAQLGERATIYDFSDASSSGGRRK